MDGARLSRYPQLSWFRYGVANDRAVDRRDALQLRSVCHTLRLMEVGRQDVAMMARGIESRWREAPGSVTFLPADGQRTSFEIESSAGARLLVLLIPVGHVVPPSGEGDLGLRPMIAVRDDVLVECVKRLMTGGNGRDGAIDGSVDESARRLVMRLVQRYGDGSPDWYDEASVFERRVLEGIVEAIDGRIRRTLSVTQLASSAGISPSHFARKFRQSTGLSVARFVNRRRVAAAMPLLRADDAPVATIARHLGFASQSHFTRIFGGLTGMTPARFREQFKDG